MTFARSATILVLFFCVSVCFTQVQHKKPLRRVDFIRDSTEIMRVKLVRPQFRFDNRNLFFKGQTLSINGLDAGVLLKDKLRLTVGYYSINNNLDALKKTVEEVEYERNLDLKYGSLNSEFIYKNTRFLSLGMPFDFGFGYNTLTYQDPISGNVLSRAGGFVVIADFGLSATFKPIRWVGLKAILGYRKTVLNLVKDFHFDGLFTSIGLNIDFREIIKDVKMMRLKKKYRRGARVENAVDLITD